MDERAGLVDRERDGFAGKIEGMGRESDQTLDGLDSCEGPLEREDSQGEQGAEQRQEGERGWSWGWGEEEEGCLGCFRDGDLEV